MPTKTTKKLEHRQEALETLRKQIKPGDTIYTVLRHRSSSGMYRAIDVYTIKDNVPLRWSWSVALALNMRYDKKHEAVGVTGCGMDMGYHIVNNLEYALYGFGKDSLGKLNHRWI